MTPRKCETIIEEWVVDVKPTGQGAVVSSGATTEPFFSFHFLLKGREAMGERPTESLNEPEWSDGFGKRKERDGGRRGRRGRGSEGVQVEGIRHSA